MYSKKLAALVAASLVVATSPAVAQPSAEALSVSSTRAAAELKGENELAGGGIWAALIGLALVAALVLVVIDDDDVNPPNSP